VRIGRRTFLKFAGFSSSALLFFSARLPKLFAGKWEHGETNWWKDGTFHQDHVKIETIGNGTINAKVDGTWQEFRIRQFSQDFIDWNFSRRLEKLNELSLMLEGEGARPGYSGPHNGIVATYGMRRKDSVFSLNNAVKGMGFAPAREKLKDAIELLRSTIEKPFPEKIDILKNNYKNRELYDMSCQVSLELYSAPDFETHTFLNQMENPLSTIVFLDIPSFEIRCVARLIHPDDPLATPYEKDVLDYTNLVHSYFHGKFDKIFITAIYYCIEEFDNTPGEKRGVRTIPPLPVENVEDIEKTKE
jgi:hypothetical protein